MRCRRWFRGEGIEFRLPLTKFHIFAWFVEAHEIWFVRLDLFTSIEVYRMSRQVAFSFILALVAIWNSASCSAEDFPPVENFGDLTGHGLNVQRTMRLFGGEHAGAGK